MDDNNSDITKLIILIVGVATISLFAYLIYKDKQLTQFQNNPLNKLNDLSKLEQQILQLNTKVDNFKNIQTMNAEIKEPERQIVSLNSKPRLKQSRAEFFGMIS